MQIYPNDHLDKHADMYACERIEQMTRPHEDALVDLYYTVVHPAYPIMEEKAAFNRARQERRVRMSLRTLVMCHALRFWHLLRTQFKGRKPDELPLRLFALDAINIETRTPNLDSIKALLLYLQLPSVIIREPNRPGMWELTALSVAMSQDIGLHVEPAQWDIPLRERKERRVLWWAIYLQDKWLSHWLGRPSHITSNGWNVSPLTLDDFCAADGMPSAGSTNTARTFMAHVELAGIVDDVLESFYTVRHNLSRSGKQQVRSEVNVIRQQWRDWKQRTVYLIDSGDHSPLSKSSLGSNKARAHQSLSIQSRPVKLRRRVHAPPCYYPLQ